MPGSQSHNTRPALQLCPCAWAIDTLDGQARTGHGSRIPWIRLKLYRTISPIDPDTPAARFMTGWQGISLDLIDVVASRLARADRRLDRLDLVDVVAAWAVLAGEPLKGRDSANIRLMFRSEKPFTSGSSFRSSRASRGTTAAPCSSARAAQVAAWHFGDVFPRVATSLLEPGHSITLISPQSCCQIVARLILTDRQRAQRGAASTPDTSVIQSW